MMNIIPGIESSVAAMSAERLRMEVVSQNIANAHVTRTPEGGPYRRHQVVFESVLQGRLDAAEAGSRSAPRSVQVSRVELDQSPFIDVYDPNHPDSDANGYVRMPNVSINHEMVDLVTATRAYEANLAAMKFARAMAVETLSIGRRS